MRCGRSESGGGSQQPPLHPPFPCIGAASGDGLRLPACNAGLQLPACLSAALLMDRSSHRASVLPHRRTTTPSMPCWTTAPIMPQCCPIEGLQLPASFVVRFNAGLQLPSCLAARPSAGLQLPACLCAALWKDYSSHHALLGMPCRAQCWTTTPSMPQCCPIPPIMPCCRASVLPYGRTPAPSMPQCCPMEGLQLPACLASGPNAGLQLPACPALQLPSCLAAQPTSSSHHPQCLSAPPPPPLPAPWGEGKGERGKGGEGGRIGEGFPPPSSLPPPRPLKPHGGPAPIGPPPPRPRGGRFEGL